MRPLRLVLSAFGPYAGEVALDFGPLADAGLFLLHGPTGGGKTSVLDAMVYALYGDVPGDRHRDALRSHHAEPTTPTRVAFDFSLRGQDWRVVRAPRQQRPKRRGSGTTTHQPSAVLLRLLPGDEPPGGPDAGARWEPVAEGAVEVGAQVVDLLGLDRVQFQQVVVLPQGAVAAALRADARERERLLTTLFGVDRFQAYADFLQQRAKALEEAVATEQQDLDRLRMRALDRWIEIDGRPRTAEPDRDDPGLNEAGLDEAGRDEPRDIAALAGAARTAAERAQEAAVTARGAAERARADERAAEDLLARWTRRRQAEAVLAAAAERAQAIAEDRRRLEAARRARPCGPALDAVVRAEADLADAARACVAATAALPALRAAVPQALLDDQGNAGGPGEGGEQGEPPASPGGPAARAPAAGAGADDEAAQGDDALADVLAAAAARIDGAEEAAEAGARARAEARRLAVAAADAAAHAEDLAAAVDDGERHAAERREALEVARGAAARLDELAAGARRLRSLASAVEALPEAERGHEQAASQHRDAVDGARRAAQTHLDVLRARIDGMAGTLAASLRAGTPCPVCGACRHPEPASAADAVEEAAVIAAEEQAAAAEAAVQGTAAELSQRERRLHELRAQVEAAATPGCDLTWEPARAAREAERRLAKAQTVAARLHDLQQEARTAHDALGPLRGARGDAAEAAATARAGATAARRRAAEEAAQVQRLLGSADARGRAHVRAAREAVERLREAAQGVGVARRARRDAEAALRTCRERADELLASCGFTDRAEVQAALLEDDAAVVLHERVGAHERDVAVAQAALADPALALPALGQPPALEGLREEREQAEKDADVTVSRCAVVQRAAEELVALSQDITAREQVLGPQQEQAARVRWLADLCAGGGNDLKMSLKRFVLAAYLEEVAAAASLRLAAMTDGRYTLHHSDDRARHGAASGLSLVVADAHTGRRRDVGTLSGGETFQAALAFALGLADVVQAHAGGVHLDTLFVDEGFGALDGDALDDAMAELDRLRAGGRMVGVVSHVVALRERLGVGIAVTRSTTGSTARVIA